MIKMKIRVVRGWIVLERGDGISVLVKVPCPS